MSKRELPFADLAQRMAGCSILPLVPKNQRPAIEQIIKAFELDGEMCSFSGMSVNVLAWYLVEQRIPFVIEYRPDVVGWVIKKAPKNG